MPRHQQVLLSLLDAFALPARPYYYRYCCLESAYLRTGIIARYTVSCCYVTGTTAVCSPLVVYFSFFGASLRLMCWYQFRGYNTAVTGDDGVARDTPINEASDMLGEKHQPNP